MPSQNQEKYYFGQKWIHDLLLKLLAQDDQRIKDLKPKNKNRALNLF